MTHGWWTLALAIALVACGGDEGGDTTGENGEQPLHGCADADFVDATEIAFENIQYTPRCARVAAGDTVTYKGEFASHNLQGGTVVDGWGTADESSPIQLVTSGTEAGVTFSQAGTFPYYCVQHQGVDMVGVVRVE